MRSTRIPFNRSDMLVAKGLKGLLASNNLTQAYASLVADYSGMQSMQACDGFRALEAAGLVELYGGSGVQFNRKFARPTARCATFFELITEETLFCTRLTDALVEVCSVFAGTAGETIPLTTIKEPMAGSQRVRTVVKNLAFYNLVNLQHAENGRGFVELTQQGERFVPAVAALDRFFAE